MALIPNGRRRVQAQTPLDYQNTGLDSGEVSQDVATPAPETTGPATDFGQLGDQLSAPQEQAAVPDMSGLDATNDTGLDSDSVGAFRNELIEALAQVSVDPERAKLVAKRALTIGYKNPQEDILSGEFLVPAKDEVPITQVKSVFAPIIDKHGFVLTSLKPHQNTGKTGKKVVDYWKLEFETKVEDPNEQAVEGDYSDMLDASDLNGDQPMARAAESQHSLIRNSRSKLLDFMLEELARKGEV